MSVYLVEALAAVLIGALTVGLLWTHCAQRAVRHQKRMMQLRLSLRLFETYNQAMCGFLDNPAMPDVLKTALVSAGEALSSRDVVNQIAKMLEAMELPTPSDEDREVEHALAALHAVDPKAHDLFVSALLSMLMANILRWSESARIFDAVATRIAIEPNRNTEVVAIASRFRNGNLPFALKPSAGLATV